MRLLSNLETTCFRMAQISCQRAQSRGCSSYAECSRDYPNLVPTSAEPRLLRCAMLGRVMMPIGTASCTACNTRFIISPSPSGLPFGVPFGRKHFVVARAMPSAAEIIQIHSSPAGFHPRQDLAFLFGQCAMCPGDCESNGKSCPALDRKWPCHNGECPGESYSPSRRTGRCYNCPGQ